MDTDLATQLISMRVGQTQAVAEIAIMRKSHEMEMLAIDMIDSAARPPPAPAGQGIHVDKRA